MRIDELRREILKPGPVFVEARIAGCNLLVEAVKKDLLQELADWGQYADGTYEFSVEVRQPRGGRPGPLWIWSH